MAFDHSTLRQSVARLLPGFGIRDYLSQFYQIYESAADASDKSSGESEFVRRMTEETDPNSMELEKLLKRTNQMIREAVRLLALIAPLPVDGKAVSLRPTEQRAFHESLFRSLFQIRVNLRRMFELAFECEEDPDEYVEHLRKKYDLADAELEAFTMNWVDTYETICQGLLDQTFRLMIFGGEEANFRLDTEGGRPALGAPPWLMTDNQLIISRDYFFLQILTVLKHVEVMTKVSSLEENQPYEDDDIPITEMFEMGAVLPIAEALMDRE